MVHAAGGRLLDPGDTIAKGRSIFSRPFVSQAPSLRERGAASAGIEGHDRLGSLTISPSVAAQHASFQTTAHETAEQEDRMWFAGIDWADEQHAVAIVDETGHPHGTLRVAHSAAGCVSLIMFQTLLIMFQTGRAVVAPGRWSASTSRSSPSSPTSTCRDWAPWAFPRRLSVWNSVTKYRVCASTGMLCAKSVWNIATKYQPVAMGRQPCIAAGSAHGPVWNIIRPSVKDRVTRRKVDKTARLLDAARGCAALNIPNDGGCFVTWRIW